MSGQEPTPKTQAEPGHGGGSTSGTGMTILVTGGGTGGHINPGLAVVAELERLLPQARFVWVGTRDRLEARLVPQAGIPIEFIDVAFLKGKGLAGKLSTLARLPIGLLQAVRITLRHDPKVVIGVGGYASGPVTLAAALRGIPTVILEQNARPGLTNRILGPLADRIYVSFEESSRWFSPDRVRFFGNPVRSSLLKREALVSRGSDPTRHLLVIGGSQGAASLNLFLPEVLLEVERRGVKLAIRHSAGKGRVAEVQACYGGVPFVEVNEYIDDMADAYTWADFIICRSGASTVAEITALGKPAMYIPFPEAADNHQEKNARAVVERQGGILALDHELKTAPPVERLVGLLTDDRSLAAMGQAAQRLGRPEAARRIAKDILDLLEVC
ncbi:MAG: undecaprenyldiphospho-muramoylpentapeptide beta-N-acetylglucosaminyltransferase [Bradymonadales bacterium]|nr:undecaprenyldiphospho-muramoylpentapeptide beta-N-acetylglucosaminyltransferase [Bradymonadales bacterium]